MSLGKYSKHTFWAPAEPAPKRYILWTCLKTFSFFYVTIFVDVLMSFNDSVTDLNGFVTPELFGAENYDEGQGIVRKGILLDGVGNYIWIFLLYYFIA